MSLTTSLPDRATRLALRDLALRACQHGGAVALSRFRSSGLAVTTKADASPVTLADQETEAAIRALLDAERPGDGWLGEETGEEEGISGLRWIVDPIDGTRNFIRGVPLWSTLVACEAVLPTGPQVVASAVGFPALNEWYDAAFELGARCDGEAIAVSTIDRLDQSLWCFETPAWFDHAGIGPLFTQLCQATALQRGLCDAYGHALVASGRAELVVEPSLSTWDVAATSLLVTEAGGQFSDLDGKATIRSGNAVVSNGRCHDQVVGMIAAARTSTH